MQIEGLTRPAAAQPPDLMRTAQPRGDNQELELEEYYKQPQNETQFDYLYITPDAASIGLKEWTRDSILSSYDSTTQKKIGWCVEELRILENMAADAKAVGDWDLINTFIRPVFRFNLSEKTYYEESSRNLKGFNATNSRSKYSFLQELHQQEDVTKKSGGVLGGLKFPKLGGGSKGEDIMPRMGWDGL